MGDTDKQLLWKLMREKQVTAEAVRHYFRAEEPPIAVARIATGMGIELTEGLGAALAGKLELSRERARIWTSSEEGKESRRYTLAYLVGQTLHMPFGEYQLPIGHETMDTRSEVSFFARDLLMPREMLRRLLFEGGQEEAHMAQRLGVSLYQLQVRMVELDLPRPPPPQKPPPEAPEDLIRTITKPPQQRASIDFEVDDEDLADLTATRTDHRPLPLEDRTEPAGYAERRREERIDARVEVRFSLPGQAANALRAYSKDISLGGLCLKTTKPHAVGELLEVTMVVGAEQYRLQARVAWVRGDAAGLRFINVGAEDAQRLQRLVQSLKR